MQIISTSIGHIGSCLPFLTPAQIAALTRSSHSLVSTLMKGSHWQQVIWHLDDMLQLRHAPDCIAYNAGLSACEKVHLWERALQMFVKICNAAVQPSIVTCNSLISACAKGLQWKRALLIFSELSSSQLQRDLVSYNATVS